MPMLGVHKWLLPDVPTLRFGTPQSQALALKSKFMATHTFILPIMAAILLSACSAEPPAVPEPPEMPASAAAPASTPPQPTEAPTQPWRLVHSQGVMHFVHINESHWKDQDQYRLAIAEICAGKNICQVMFWKDPSIVPTAMPMSDVQVAAKVAHWQYNGNTGHRQLLWSCEIVDDPSECFSGN